MKKEDLQATANSLLANDAYVRMPKLDGLTPDQLREKLQEQWQLLGVHLMDLMKKNQFNDEALNRFYYGLLKFQEFLKKHQEKESETSGSFFSALKKTITQGLSTRIPAIQRLEDSIKASTLSMAKKSILMLRDQVVQFPKDKQFLAVITEIEKRLG